MSEIELYDRRTGRIVREVVYEERAMKLLYGTRLGRWFTELVLRAPLFSRIYGFLQRRRATRSKIAPFVERHGIDPTESEMPPGRYPSFAAFFARRIKPERRPVDRDPDALVAPADGRLLALPVRQGRVYPVKGTRFSLDDLVPGGSLDERYDGGCCLILRLAPSDYHRFCYLDDGVQSPVVPVAGGLHSVSPLALRHGIRVFPRNYRHCCTIETRSFGPVAQIEVGALTVGSIRQVRPEGGPARRGEEKGWFELGGSTIILLLEAGRARVDPEIVEHSREGVETLVRLGECVGVRASDVAEGEEPSVGERGAPEGVPAEPADR